MTRERPLTLGIETSCDDTACAVVDGCGRVLSSAVSSQLTTHRPYGGVVPELASREHLAAWPEVSRAALEPLGLELSDVDQVAATRGPGLVGSLLVGLSLGKALAFSLDKPFFAVHHLEGHLYSPLLSDSGDAAESPPDHLVALVVSGGHTSLYRVAGGDIALLSETRDDAMGEVFDKVGKRLGLPYPQGPEVDRLAEEGDASRHPMPSPRCGESLDFSYSGLKTRALMDLEKLEREGVAPTSPRVGDLLAGFRSAAVGQILNRLSRLHKQEPIPFLAVSGGAAANRLLRREVDAWAATEGVDLRLVPLRYAGDNAAMIAHAALLRSRRGEADDALAAEAASRIPMDSGGR